MRRPRLRELGIEIGGLPTGPANAITDVLGVRVGYATLIQDTPTVIRTGVTAIWPRGPEIFEDSVFAGVHSLNGYGEMTGTLWIDEQGLVTTPICITNTYSVGVVRDAVCDYALKRSDPAGVASAAILPLPVVAETWDGRLSDIESQAVTRDMAFEALDGAAAGVIAEGNVGGGAGMVCHGFKGGTGTASRVTAAGYVVGALVQANYGAREHLRIDGVPIGRELGVDLYPAPARASAPDTGSIIVVLATDAPLLPIQCQRLAQRASIGLARVGGYGSSTSGDIFLAFSTSNHIHEGRAVHEVTMLGAREMSPLFLAAAEAVEEAILNALCAAETMVGRNGATAHALPIEQMMDIMKRYRWPLHPGA